MIAAFLLIASVAAQPPAARNQATATARIVTGERIRFAAGRPASGQFATRGVQRSFILRKREPQEGGELRLVEFQ
jgi:hypothetical protein